MSTANAAVEAGFYSGVDETGAATEAGEEALHVIESSAARIIRLIDTGAYPLNEEDRLVLAVFMAFQMTRTREFRQSYEALGDFTSRALLELNLQSMSDDEIQTLFAEDSGNAADVATIDPQQIREVIQDLRVRPNSNQSLVTMARMALNLAPFLLDRPWTLLKYGERGFLTSDRPVALWRNVRTAQFPNSVGGLSADEIYLPLDPENALVLGTGPLTDTIVDVVEPKRVKHINTALAQWSYEWIFHHPKHNPLKGIHVPHEPPTLHINGMPAQPGVNLWKNVRDQFLDPSTRKFIHVQWNHPGKR